MGVKIQVARCGRCGKPRGLTHTCVTSATSKRKPGRTRLAPQRHGHLRHLRQAPRPGPHLHRPHRLQAAQGRRGTAAGRRPQARQAAEAAAKRKAAAQAAAAEGRSGSRSEAAGRRRPQAQGRRRPGRAPQGRHRAAQGHDGTRRADPQRAARLPRLHRRALRAALLPDLEGSLPRGPGSRVRDGLRNRLRGRVRRRIPRRARVLPARTAGERPWPDVLLIALGRVRLLGRQRLRLPVPALRAVRRHRPQAGQHPPPVRPVPPLLRHRPRAADRLPHRAPRRAVGPLRDRQGTPAPPGPQSRRTRHPAPAAQPALTRAITPTRRRTARDHRHHHRGRALPGLPRRARARQLPARPRPRPPRHQPVLVIGPRPVDLASPARSAPASATASNPHREDP